MIEHSIIGITFVKVYILLNIYVLFKYILRHQEGLNILDQFFAAKNINTQSVSVSILKYNASNLIEIESQLAK